MKIIHSDYKKGLVKVKILSMDDLWYLSHILHEGDLLSGSTYRKIVYNENEGERKRVYLKINVEKIKFHEFSNVLRVLGRIRQSSDENIPLGDYHSFNISVKDVITIEKEHWSNVSKNYLKRSLEKSGVKLMIVACDWGDASFAFYHEYGLEYSGTFSEELGGKKELKKFEENKKAFVEKLLETINSIAKTKGIKRVLIGGATTVKKALKRLIKDYGYLKGKTTLVKVNYSGRNGVKELVEEGYVDKIISKSIYSQHVRLVNELFKRVAKSGKATYGFEHVKRAVKNGAVKHLLLTNKYIKEKRREEEYKVLDDLIQLAESMRGEVHIIPSNTEHGEELDNLTGVAALLRYKMNS